MMTGACRTAEGQAQPKLSVETLTVTTNDGRNVTVNAELARSETEKTTGLMFRRTLADGDGMLFIWKTDRVLSFWMKNTLIPLSIAYIDRNGIIREIHDMKSGQLNTVQSFRSVRYALEVPLGWFGRAGIGVNDTISLPKEHGR
jgi:uncharacterized membrane protein (UPF0127 family)